MTPKRQGSNIELHFPLTSIPDSPAPQPLSQPESISTGCSHLAFPRLLLLFSLAESVSQDYLREDHYLHPTLFLFFAVQTNYISHCVSIPFTLSQALLFLFSRV